MREQKCAAKVVVNRSIAMPPLRVALTATAPAPRRSSRGTLSRHGTSAFDRRPAKRRGISRSRASVRSTALKASRSPFCPRARKSRRAVRLGCPSCGGHRKYRQARQAHPKALRLAPPLQVRVAVFARVTHTVALTNIHAFSSRSAIAALHARPKVPLLSQVPNPPIERTFQRPLRALWPAAHVKR